MANKKIEVEVKAKGDTSGLEDFSEKLEELQSKGVEAGDAVSDSLENVSGAASDASSGLDDISSSADSATESTDALGGAVNGIDGSPLDEVATSADGIADSVSGATGEIDDMTAALGVLAGIGVTATIDSMAMSASNAEGTMRGLAAVMNVTEGTTDYDNLTSSIGKLSDASGLGKGQIRGMTTELGMMGIQNVDTAMQINEMATQMSFLKTNTNDAAPAIANAIGSLTMRDSLGARQLKSAGMDMNTLARESGKTKEEIQELWKTMSQEQRAEFLVQYGMDADNVEAANKNMAESYDALKDQANNAWAGIMTTLGQTVLPILVPALELFGAGLRGARDLLNMLPAPVQGFIGVAIVMFGTLVMGASTLVGLFGILGKVDGVLRAVGISFQFVGKSGMITGMLSTVKGAVSGLITTLRSLSLAQAATALKSGILTIAGYAQAAMWAVLNFVMSLNPITIIIIAIVALIAVIVYLYYNVDSVREAIDGFGQAIKEAAQWLYEGLVAAINEVIAWFQNLRQSIIDFAINAYNSILNFVNQAVQGFWMFVTFISTLPMQIWNYLVQIITRVASFGSNVVTSMKNTATNMVTGFISKIATIPGQIKDEFMKMINYVKNLGAQLVSAGKQVAIDFVMNFVNLGLGRRSPGLIQRNTIAEIDETLERFEDESPNAQRIGGKVANSLVTGYNEVKSLFNSNVDLPNNIPDNKQNTVLSNNTNNNSTRSIRDLILNIGSVNDDETIDEIIDKIIKILTFDNLTAGRIEDY